MACAGRVLYLLFLSLCISLRFGFVVFLVLFGFSLKSGFVVFFVLFGFSLKSGGGIFCVVLLISLALDYGCDICFSCF